MIDLNSFMALISEFVRRGGNPKMIGTPPFIPTPSTPPSQVQVPSVIPQTMPLPGPPPPATIPNQGGTASQIGSGIGSILRAALVSGATPNRQYGGLSDILAGPLNALNDQTQQEELRRKRKIEEEARAEEKRVREAQAKYYEAQAESAKALAAQRDEGPKVVGTTGYFDKDKKFIPFPKAPRVFKDPEEYYTSILADPEASQEDKNSAWSKIQEYKALGKSTEKELKPIKTGEAEHDGKTWVYWVEADGTKKEVAVGDAAKPKTAAGDVQDRWLKSQAEQAVADKDTEIARAQAEFDKAKQKLEENGPNAPKTAGLGQLNWSQYETALRAIEDVLFAAKNQAEAKFGHRLTALGLQYTPYQHPHPSSQRKSSTPAPQTTAPGQSDIPANPYRSSPRP